MNEKAEKHTQEKKLPSAQPEQAECIQDTKAVLDDRDMVSLSERVSATYYDDEHEEWSQKTVTIRDLLDGICDEYTVLPSAQPEIIRCKDCKFYSPMNRETKTGICNLIMHQNFGDNWFCAGAERRTE